MDYVDFVDRVMTAIATQWRAAGPSGQAVGIDLGQATDDLLSEASLGEAQRTLVMLDAVRDLEDMGLVTFRSRHSVALSQEGRKFPDASLPSAWPQIFEIFVDQDQVEFLDSVVELSMTGQGEYAALSWVDLKDVDASLGGEWDRDAALQASSFARSLDDMGLVRFRGTLGGGTIRPTYVGVVRVTREEPTESYQLLSRLVAEGETTNADFKRELNLRRDREKAEFVRDVLALGNTKSSGERFLIIGIEDDGAPYAQPVDATITQERLEQILQSYAEPWPPIRYRVAQWQATTVGILQVLREPEKLPHLPTRTLARLVEGEVYVRHGSHTEPATPAERESLFAEGRRARSET